MGQPDCKRFQLTHVVTDDTSALRERQNIGNNEYTWKGVRGM